MDESLKEKLHWLFRASYKRTAGILIILSFLLAIPVAVNLLGQKAGPQDKTQEPQTVTVFSGGNCGAFGCDGPNLTVSWPKPIFQIRHKCCFSINWSPWIRIENNTSYTSQFDIFDFEVQVLGLTSDGRNVQWYPYFQGNVNGKSKTARWPTPDYSLKLTQVGSLTGACSGITNPCVDKGITQSNTFTFRGLSPQTTYDLFIWIVHSPNILFNIQAKLGPTGPCQGGFCAASPSPTAPTGFTITLNLTGATCPDNRVDLSWNAVTGETRYEIYRRYEKDTNPLPQLIVSTNATSYGDTNVVRNNNFAYIYQIKGRTTGALSKFKPIVLPVCPTSTVTAPPSATAAPEPTAVVTTPPTVTTPPNVTVSPGQEPTATVSPFDANILLTLSLHGIGSNTSVGQNPNPVLQTRTANYEVYDSGGKKVKEGTADLKFDSPSSAYKGIVSAGRISQVLGGIIGGGTYKVRVKFDNTLWRAITGISLQIRETTQAPPTTLISGDLDQTNELNLLDYNIMLACYGDKACDKKTQADLNLDGKVDELDLNILYFEFATRQGD